MKLFSLIVVCLFALNTYAQDAAPVAPVPAAPAPKQLRKRTHGMNWEYSASTVKTTNDTTTTESDTTRGELSIAYVYNLGHFELGVQASSLVQKDNTTGKEDSMGFFAFLGHFNFIENAPGNDLIPYISLGLGGISGKIQGNTTSTDITGSATFLGLGVKWFPLSEIFALTAQLEVGSGKYETASPKINFDMKQSAFSVGWAFYF